MINNVWIAYYQKDVEIKDGIVDKFSNPLNNRNWYHNSIVPENIPKLWFHSFKGFIYYKLELAKNFDTSWGGNFKQ